jgi:hypothetical protein
MGYSIECPLQTHPQGRIAGCLVGGRQRVHWKGAKRSFFQFDTNPHGKYHVFRRRLFPFSVCYGPDHNLPYERVSDGDKPNPMVNDSGHYFDLLCRVEKSKGGGIRYHIIIMMIKLKGGMDEVLFVSPSGLRPRPAS